MLNEEYNYKSICFFETKKADAFIVLKNVE